MRNIDSIIVHCTATRAGAPVHAAAIDACHRQRGFRKIGYHYVVCLDGSIERGRADAEIGAHCVGRNATSLGVCYVGGLDKDGRPADTRTPAQRRVLRDLIGKLCRQYGVRSVHSHRDFAAKACPCFDATKEYADLCER